MLIVKKIVFFFISALWSFSCLAWQPFDWSSTNIQGLYGGDFEFGDTKRGTATIEHAHGWKYGDNFFFVDMYNNDGFEVYAEIYSSLSLSKMSNAEVAFGPIKDVSLMLGLNISNAPVSTPFRAYLWGVEFDLGNQYFDYLKLSVAAYKEDGVATYGVQVTPVWSFPFTLLETKFKFRGFLDLKNGSTNAAGNITMLAQPQLLLDVGDLFNTKADVFYVGMEYSYWVNKFGVEGVDESAVQGMVSVFF